MTEAYADKPTDLRTPTERVEAAMDRLCQLVTEHGPTHLVRGMPSYLAHEAMLACIEHLITQRARWRDRGKGLTDGDDL